jgi:hypothetical protein
VFEDDLVDMHMGDLVMDDFDRRSNYVHRDSVPGKLANLPRDFDATHQQIYSDYFADSPIYTEELFQRRFRMPKALFLKIMEDVKFDPWFQRKPDCTGKLGAFPLLKLVAAILMLCDGTSGDLQDEYCKISETTAMNAMKFARQ